MRDSPSPEEVAQAQAEAKIFREEYGANRYLAMQLAITNLAFGGPTKESRDTLAKKNRHLIKFESTYIIGPGPSCPWCRNRACEDDGGIWAVGPRAWQVGAKRKGRVVTCGLCRRDVFIGLGGFVQRVKRKDFVGSGGEEVLRMGSHFASPPPTAEAPQ